MHLERCIPDAVVVIDGIFVGMDDEFVFTMDTLVDRIFFLIELFEVNYLRPGGRNREY